MALSTCVLFFSVMQSLNITFILVFLALASTVAVFANDVYDDFVVIYSVYYAVILYNTFFTFATGRNIVMLFIRFC